MKPAKASGSGSPTVVADLKRKRSVPFGTNNAEITKHIKVDGSSPSGRSMVKYYSDFKKSSLIHRLMYYQNGEWNNFPREIILSLKDDIVVKKTAIEVEIKGRRILLDFLHMVQVDLDTGLRQPIAWIDDSGKYFFPKIIGDGSEGADDVGSDDLKLHVEEEIKRLGDMNVKDPSGDANHENATEKDRDDEGSDSRSHNSDAETDDTTSEAAPVKNLLDLDVLWELFVNSINPDEKVDIVVIQRCTDNALDARFKLFQKQIEITEKCRGDANVVHAWFPCSQGMVSSILKYGIGYPAASRMNPLRGIYLTPANGSEISTSDLCADENGERHVLLCRVIMGNMEVVPAGSSQFHPSSEDFDSGAYDLQNPTQYTVWNMNMNTHIFPERVISYKLSSDDKGISSSQEETVKVDPAPVMPFSVLFDAIRDEVSSENMKFVMAYYELFSNEEIDRDEFIKKLRLVVGDDLLKSTIKGIRSKINPPK